MLKPIGPLVSSPAMKRYPGNPILTAEDVPYPAMLIFNAGVVKFQGRYAMAFRNDYGTPGNAKIDGSNIGLAYSDDGLHWDVQPEPCFEYDRASGTRAYDPRLTLMDDGRVCMTFAVETRYGVCGGIAMTEDFKHWQEFGWSVPDNRNMVLFPRKFGGKYVRLERPFPLYTRGLFDIWISDSPDLEYWGRGECLLAVEDVPFANDKIGPAAPPVLTDRGWLVSFHAVDVDPSRGKHGWEDRWTKRYSAGLMLLDLENPRKVLGYTRKPILAPEAPYELDEGYRTNVLFPGGMVLEDDGEVKFYYGASDTVMCLATAQLDDLLALIEPVEEGFVPGLTPRE